MKTKIATAVLALCATSAMAATSNVQWNNGALAGWERVADGVYRHTDENGVTTQLAFGEGGAKFDAEHLSSQLDELDSSAEFARRDKEAVSQRDSLMKALQGIPDTRLGLAPVVPLTTDFGSMCGGNYDYAFDSTFYVGAVGATAIARSGFGIPDWGPPAPYPSYIRQYANAQVVPHGILPSGSIGWLPAISSTQTSSSEATAPPAIASWVPYTYTYGTVGSGSCKGTTFAQVTITSAGCTPSHTYVSQTKTYPSCVNTP